MIWLLGYFDQIGVCLQLNSVLNYKYYCFHILLKIAGEQIHYKSETLKLRLSQVLTICSQRCYLLRCLKGQGLPAKQLNIVFCAIVMSRNLYALPAWGGFLTYELTAKIDSFLWKAVRWGFSSHCKCLTDLLREADLICICFVRWHQTVGIAFISYFLPQKFCPWSLEILTVYLPYPSVIITCTDILLFS